MCCLLCLVFEMCLLCLCWVCVCLYCVVLFVWLLCAVPVLSSHFKGCLLCCVVVWYDYSVFCCLCCVLCLLLKNVSVVVLCLMSAVAVLFVFLILTVSRVWLCFLFWGYFKCCWFELFVC